MAAIARPHLLLALLLVTGLVGGCSGSSDATDRATGGEVGGEDAWSFTDDFDVTHELDAVPETIVAEVSIAGALWDLGIEVDATFGQRELLDPDIIVVPSYQEGEYWGVGPDLVDDVERVAPVVSITIPGKDLRAMADRVLDLAETLGVDPDGDPVTEVVAAYEAAEDDLRAALEAKPGLTFMAASGTVDQLYVAVPSGYTDLQTYQGLGMDIVEPDTDEQYWQTLSWEQIDTYESDVLLGDLRGGSVEQIIEQIPAAARDIPAIRAGQLARWEVTLAPGYANLARILTDLTEVVEAADPNVV